MTLDIVAPRCDLCGWSGVQPRKFCGKCAAMLSMVEVPGWTGPTAVELRTIAHNILGEGFEPRRVSVDVGPDYGKRPGLRVIVCAQDRRRKHVYYLDRLIGPQIVESARHLVDVVVHEVTDLATSLAQQVPQHERKKPAPPNLESPPRNGRR